MPASMHLKTLSVRLPEADLRRFKSLAASRGISVQEAVHQALERWACETPKKSPDALDALQGSLADVHIENFMRHEKETELAKDRRWS